VKNDRQIRHWVIVPAAGSGRRMSSRKPKQYLTINGLPVLSHSLARLQQGIQPAAIVVVLSPDDLEWPAIDKPAVEIVTVDGGQERCDSVLNGLHALQNLSADNDWVWVHDAARPCVRVQDLFLLKQAIINHEVGGLLAVRMTDTVKQSDNHQQSITTVDRSNLWRALTPQVFRYRVLLEALTEALQRGDNVTDEAQAIESLGYRPCLVEGHSDNIKITHQSDLEIVGFYLKRQADVTGRGML
jgi:2-C-methyl-D-erythritol 4-phosphate cytidylyltransferase